jgi:hypothetical protein
VCGRDSNGEGGAAGVIDPIVGVALTFLIAIGILVLQERSN